MGKKESKKETKALSKITRRNAKSLVIGIISLLIMAGILTGCESTSDISDLEDRLFECNELLDKYKTALEEANTNIEEANSMIEDAQGHAWESYQEMGETLENLGTVNTVPEP